MSDLFESRMEAIQARMDVLGESATPGARAAEVAALGYPTWFGYQDGRTFTLARPSGGLRADPEKAFTTNVASLLGYQKSDSINTILFDIDYGRGKVRCVFDIEHQRVDRFKIYQSPMRLSAPTSQRAGVVQPTKPKAVAPVAVRQMSDALARLSVAERSFSEARERYANAVSKQAELASSAKDAGARAERITAQLGKRLADEIMAGREIANDHPETAKVQRLKLKEDATRLALPMAEAAVLAAKARVEKAGAERVAAVLDWAAAEQSISLAETKAALEAIAPSLTRLAAVDRIKAQFIGVSPKTTEPGHPGLRSTERLAASLIKSVPPLLLPEGMHPELFETAVLASIKSIQTNMEISK